MSQSPPKSTSSSTSNGAVNPGHKRLAKMAAAGLISARLARLLIGGAGIDEQKLATDLAALLKDTYILTSPVTQRVSTLQSEMFIYTLSAVLAFAAAVASYALKEAVRLIVLFQICLLSTVAAGFLAVYAPLEVRPATIVLAVVLGTSCGWFLKLLEERRRKKEAQFIELKLREKELLESRMTLVKQDETERRLLAADLHDQVLNDLKAIKTKIDKFAKTGEDKLPKEIFSGVDASMIEIRNIMDALSPVVLEHFGLASAAEECLERGGQRAGYMIDFDNSADKAALKKLSQIEQQLLYRLIQESITNTCKHSNARRVSISLSSEADQLLIRIKDDGKGVATERLAESRGLRYMRLRAALIGAAVAWLSPDPESGKGTVVEIRHPLSQADALSQMS